MKILVTHDLGERFIEDLRAQFPEMEIVAAYEMADRVREVVDAEVHFGAITREEFTVARQLRWVHFVGIGFDGVVRNIPEFLESDIVMTNARSTHVIPMADHVFAFMLALAHKIPEFLNDQQSRNWDQLKYFGRMQELAGATMGILAFGELGQAIARRAHGFDMDVYAVDIKPVQPPPEVRAVWPIERLDEMLRISDWLVVTAPLTNQTRGLIDRQRLQLLKTGAGVVVVSRGNIVDEGALIECLRTGQISGAGLDVTTVEPLPADSPLWDTPNIILSPHVSADSPQMWERRRQTFKENLRRYLAGESMLNVCDVKMGY